ncbi:hypothetical protein [Streptosporangium sp. NPDC004631]
MQSNPTEPERAEFLGVHFHSDKAPTSEMRTHGHNLVFDTPDEAQQFAATAQVMAAQHHIAWERNGLLPPSAPSPSAYPL